MIIPDELLRVQHGSGRCGGKFKGNMRQYAVLSRPTCAARSPPQAVPRAVRFHEPGRSLAWDGPSFWRSDPDGIPHLTPRSAPALPVHRRQDRAPRQSHLSDIRCWHTKEDRIAETIDLAWKWFVGLAKHGKDACKFPTTLASFAAKAVKSGRRLCGQLKSKDVLSELAQQRHGFCLTKLPDISTESSNPLSDALIDNTQTPPDEQAAFRIDFADWLKTLTPREHRILKAMARNERTKDLSQEFEVSQGRISQMRRYFHDSWCQFTDA